MPIHDEDVAPLAILLSPERLGALIRLTGSTKTAIELHQETLHAGADLMNVLGTIEIALRNAVCENLGGHFDAPNWLLNPPAPFEWRQRESDKIKGALDSARRAEYSKLTQAEKHALDAVAFPNGLPANLSHLGRAKGRRNHITVTNGKVIVELTFYMWKRLYGPDYEHTLWRPTLKRTFPCKKIKRADVADNLETLYQTRNRLAHHEPVLHKRLSDAIAALKFVVEHLETEKPGPKVPLARLVADDVAGVEDMAKALHAKLDSYRVAP